MSKSVQRSKRVSRKGTVARKTSTATMTTSERSKGTEKSPSKPALNKGKQTSLYEKAMQLLHAGEFAKAKGVFTQVISGPNREMAHSARVHQMACERRLTKEKLDLLTPEDHYNYAITLINNRETEQAQKHLEQALEHSKQNDHVHYALALCCGLKGDLGNAALHLRRAIEIQPRNRAAARNDPDFQILRGKPEIRALLYPERTAPA